MPDVIVNRSLFKNLALTSALALSISTTFVGVLGCTNNHEIQTSKENSNVEAAHVAPSVSPVADLSLSSSVSSTNAVANTPCKTEDLTAFDRTDGELIDLDHDLPNGLLLASKLEMQVEKKNETLPVRVMVRETLGGKGAEIACSDNVDKFGQDFEMALTGLVKYDSAHSAGMILRQFFFFQNKEGYGAVFSNPGTPEPMVDLKKVLQRGGGQLYRLNEKTYVIRYLHERGVGDIVRARLNVTLDLISQ